MPILQIILTPVLCAALGYCTNWLAIKMLFRPHRTVRVFGIRLPFTPGLIPKERRRITKKIAETLCNSLLTPETLAEGFASLDVFGGLKNLGDGATVLDALDSLGISRPEARFDAALASFLSGESGMFLSLRQAAQDFVKNATEKYYSGAVLRLKKWTEDNESLDEALSRLVKAAVTSGFGRIAGSLVDPKKIAASLKESLFAYLEDEETKPQVLAYVSGAAESLISLAAAEADGDGQKAFDAAKRLTRAVCGVKIGGLFGGAAGGAAEALMLKAAEFAAARIDIKGMIEKKLDSFAVEEAEELILGVVSREINVIMALGGVIGFFVGLAALLPQLF